MTKTATEAIQSSSNPATELPYVTRWDGSFPVCCVPSLGIELKISRLLADGDQNTKTRKNSGKGFLSCGLSMSPHKLAGIGNNCGNASPACIAACLNHTGMGSIFPMIQAARIARTMLFYTERQWFLDRLNWELIRWSAKADRKGLRLCCRPNMLSDIPWEKFGVLEQHPEIMFYDYTKRENRKQFPFENYYLTFSRSEINDATAIEKLGGGNNVAVVFHNVGKFTGNRAKFQTFPKTWNGFTVFDGDTTDLRFEDPIWLERYRNPGYVIGLRLKAPNKKQRQSAIDSGFSVAHNPA